jgi:hypothetical protein
MPHPTLVREFRQYLRRLGSPLARTATDGMLGRALHYARAGGPARAVTLEAPPPHRYAGVPGVGIDPEMIRRAGQVPHGAPQPRAPLPVPPPPRVPAVAEVAPAPRVPAVAEAPPPAFDVGREIARLKAGGWPHRQAVAIALRKQEAHAAGLPGRRQAPPAVEPPFVPRHSLAIPLHLAPPAVPGTGQRGQVTLGDVARHLEELHQARHGRALDVHNPKDRKRMVRAAAEEVAFQLHQPVSGEHWYDTDVNEAFRLTGRALPRLRTSAPLRRVLAAAGSILSGGVEPEANWQNAAHALRHYEQHGRLPLFNPRSGETWPGPQGPTMTQQLGLLQHLIDRLGEQGAARFLITPQPVGVLNRVKAEARWPDLPALGYLPEKWGFRPGEPIYRTGARIGGDQGRLLEGSYVLGEKKGPFTKGILGIPDTVVDRWMVRANNRLGGRLLRQGKMRDTPDSPAHHEAMKDLTRRVAAEVGRGEHATQALQWFHEQNLWNRLGVPTESNSYAQGARQFLAGLGWPI